MKQVAAFKKPKKLTKKEEIKANRHFDIGKKYYRDGNFPKAIEELSKVLEYRPRSGVCISLIAGAALECSDFELALKLNFQALILEPTNQMVINNCGKYWETVGDWGNAVKFYLAALKTNPDSITIKNNCGLALLRCGDLKNGFEMWEARHEVAHALGQRMARLNPRDFKQPLWDGSPLIGKKLIVWCEQGVGDEMLYGTMLNDLKKYGGAITVECDRRLVELYKRSYPSFNIVPSRYKIAEDNVDMFDYQCSVGSLGRILRQSYSDFPDICDILVPDPKQVEKWKKRFAAISDRPKIGISWRSMKSGFDRDMHYARIQDLKPLTEIPNVDFINMQYTWKQTELDEFEELFGKKIHTWEDINLKDDLDELTAYVRCLDVNISPASTPVSFSGSQNIPSCVFMNNDERNVNTLASGRYIWYPSAKIYYKEKNEEDKDWQLTFMKIAKDLTEKFSK